ncbi:MAG: oligosaccharide flippase family protein [Longimicrobiales bacterium]
MSDVLSKLGRQTPIYVLGILANRLAGFLMLPIYTSYLRPADYGVLELLTLTVEAIGIMGAVGLSAGVMKFHAAYESAQDKREVISTSALGIIGLMTIVAGAGVAASGPLSAVILGEAGSPTLFRIFFVIYLLQQAEIVPLLLLRVQGRAVAFVVVNLTKLALMLVMNVWFVVYEGLGVLGVLVSNLIASSLFSVGLMAYLLISSGRAFSGPKFREMLRFGRPMMFWFLGSFVMVSSDRFFLNHFAGPYEVGLYSLAYRFMAILPALTFVPFYQAWDPQRFGLAGEKGVAETFTRAFTYLNIAIAGVALGICVFTEDVIRVMATPEFYAAHQVVPLLIASQILWSLVGFVNLGLLLRDRTDILGRLAVVTVLVILGLDLALIPRFGIIGAATATLITYALRFALVLRASQQHYRIDYDWQRVFSVYAIAVVVVVVDVLLPSLPVAISMVVGLALISVALLAAWAIVLNHRERAYIFSLLRSLRDVIWRGA